MGLSAPDTITCPDCGGVAHLLTRFHPEDPPEPGDVAAYRCEDCRDRWDMVLGDDDDSRPDSDGSTPGEVR